MTAPWTPTGDTWPQPAMVMVAHIKPVEGVSVRVGDDGKTCWMPHTALLPMPPAITPQQQAVLDAAVELMRNVGGVSSDHAEFARLMITVRAMLAAQQPSDPVKELLKAARALIDLHERNTCQHENTKRGGTMWTICEDCDFRWADDEGGFKPYSEPAEIVNARAAIAALEAKS